jgi:Ulp1 family protease
MVFNLDKHNQSGSHWISLFINIAKREINFWDSFAMSPPAEVANLIKKVKAQGKKLGINFKVQINMRKHQLKNTECGVYSINFIVEQLEGKTFKEVCNTIIRDEAMNSRRKLYFSRNA